MAESYRLKAILFLGRRVPIVVQNENGPCPMLALANVMLLRNQIHLSPEAPEVTQVRPASSPCPAVISGSLLGSMMRLALDIRNFFTEERGFTIHCLYARIMCRSGSCP